VRPGQIAEAQQEFADYLAAGEADLESVAHDPRIRK